MVRHDDAEIETIITHLRTTAERVLLALGYPQDRWREAEPADTTSLGAGLIEGSRTLLYENLNERVVCRYELLSPRGTREVTITMSAWWLGSALMFGYEDTEELRPDGDFDVFVASLRGDIDRKRH